MKTTIIRKILTRSSMLAAFSLTFCFSCFGLLGQDSVEKLTEKKPGTVEEKSIELSTRQSNLADRYQTLEQKLFKLHEFELSTNPDRSRLLKQAYQKSQDQLTQKQLSTVVKLLSNREWKTAISSQEVALADLKALLKLLESEDRSKRIRDRQDQIKEYIAEVDRIMRIQKGIRGQNEGGVDQERLAKSQNKAAQRTEDLNKRIKEDEGESKDESKSDSEDAKEPTGKIPDGEKSDGEKSDGEKSDGEKSDGEKSDGEKSDSEKSDGEKSDGEKSDGEKSDGKPSQGKPTQGKPGPEDQPQQQKENPVQDRIKAAEEKMRKAEEDLKNAKREDSIKEMEQAEQELAKAKKELEEILRQLREEEVERSLAALEDRFRRMLENQIRIQEKTKLYAKTQPKQRGSEFEIAVGKLGIDQRNIAMDADRTLLLLREDASSIAFPETVEQLRDDMFQVASRLAAVKVEAMTQEIEADIIETLNDLIQALIQAQDDKEKQKQKPSSQGQQGKPGEQPLVDKIAELKMVRGLQIRINKRHKRYAQLLDDPDDPIGFSEDPEITSALDRLSERQLKVQTITRDIVEGKNN